MVGYGRVDITPTGSVYLAGLGSEDPPRYSQGITDRLYATCIAFTDKNGNTILMYHMDLLNAYDYLVSQRNKISYATGVPVENIIIAATHNHSGPSLETNGADNYISTYKAYLVDWLIDSAIEAMEDRKPADMYITSTNPKNLNFVRHYTYINGSINGYGGSNTAIGHTLAADNQMQLIKFVRQGGKDVVLMNWQGHPRGHVKSEGLYYQILSDVDVIRKEIEEDLNCYFAFFLGASGNVNNSSAISWEQRTKNYVEHGKALAAEAVAAAAKFTKVETGNVQIRTQKVAAEKKDPTSSYNKYINATAFSIGDVAFAVAGYEMFSENGQDIKEASQFKMTFIVTCANGDNKYIPSEATYAYDNYEVNASRYAKGTAEELVKNYNYLLKQLYKTK